MTLRPAERPPVRGGETRVRRAHLTIVSRSVQQVARLVVMFVLTPLIIRGLGQQLYGAWVMIQQLVGYTALADLRPAGTLKYLLSVEQHRDDWAERRRQIGAAVVFAVLTLPLALLMLVALTWAAPSIIRTGPELVGAVRVAVAIAVAGWAIEQIAMLPENVLRGLNLEYRAIGVGALGIVVGGLLSVLAVRLGYGLPGLAAAGVAGTLLFAGARLWVVKRALPEFGVAWPKRSELRRFSSFSGWIFLSSLAYVVLMASDYILLGLLMGPHAAAVFATTSAVVRQGGAPLMQVLSAGNVGIAGLAGAGNWKRVFEVRRELLTMAVGVFAVTGAGVILLNESFLRLWVGPGFYGGDAVNLLLVLVALQSAVFHLDSVLVDCLLAVRTKTAALLASGVASLLLCVLLVPRFGLAGMAAGTLLGRAGLIWYFPWLAARRTGHSWWAQTRPLLRPAAAGGLLVLLASLAEPWVQVRSWLVLLPVGALAALAGGALYVALLAREDRQRITGRVRQALGRSASPPGGS